MTAELARREFLKAVGGLSVLSLLPRSRPTVPSGSRPGPGQPGRFLDAHELDTLRAATARLLPGPPEDPDPGALEAGCAEAIDRLLGAFTFTPPLIHAGGPFSNRAGQSHDDLADFVPLDSLAELGWRIRLEGSQGRAERLFAGPVVGLQEVYRKGLADLDAKARPSFPGFAAAGPDVQDRLLQDPSGADFTASLLSDALAAMYGPPEYGGNRDLAGWEAIGWPGDVQPRGYRDAEVSELDGHRGSPLGASAARRALEQFIVGVEGLR